MSTPKERTLEEVAFEFREWRSQKKYKQEKIPKKLWSKAIELTLLHSSSKVAKKLGLNLTDLKKRLELTDSPEAALKLSQTFIETQLPFSPMDSAPVCQSVEFERVDGSKMKLHASPDQPFDLHALMNVFLEDNHAASHPTN